ncbi:hypothetical protein F3Y22_tig00110013pilonHSYRG00322 [Hibiscus syriacus]|uniref:GPI inositol-deacylase n=1 Tax=Hibiscus syriacus TaxID=106335 RepID=A0A6A3BUC5_HIBSY|nr:hypothetical protein F3Y22_tig00110013pilonHSYRG00322 [Hibiscus syriacus]
MLNNTENERRNNNKNDDSRMRGFRPSLRAMMFVVAVIWIGVAALYGLLKPISNGCIMTYMYPTYIPISTMEGGASAKYGLYLYHEGWKKIDFAEHLKKLNGIPVLFIPGNGGSYKQARSFFYHFYNFGYVFQVRSLAAESDRAYQGGPLERTFYREAYLASDEGGNVDMADIQLPNQYANRLDWFAVDLEGEHSAMDGRILEEHTEYVVYAIHRVLDQYKESRDARESDGAATAGRLPKNVILVGHSMGGFVARAATIHHHLRKSAVKTIVTLSSPTSHLLSRYNHPWVTTIKVRSRLESLDGIVPSTHGFMISSTSMKNVWLSMEHQTILWCNQLVVQMSHTLLSLVDSRTGRPFPETQKRLAIFTKMLHSEIPQSFNWKMQPQSSWFARVPAKDVKNTVGPQVHTLSDCPSSFHWNDDILERDLYIQTATVTILAMDGRRRWLDIHNLGENGKGHFIFVTNLAPCSGVRVHLWPQKGKSSSDLPAGKKVLEVTSKMVQIPAGPAPRQVEPGSQTEQAPPSAVLHLAPEEMHGFRFLTISVAPRPTISGRPPPATSMAVGQFFNPDEGKLEFSPVLMLLSIHSHKDIFLKEDHPLAFNLSFAISLGLLPVSFSLKTAGCGIKDSALLDEAGDTGNTKLCKLRCFPPVALAWDPTSGLHVFPNLYSETLLVDSSPALWTSTGTEKTTVLLLLDPHCAYKASIDVSVTTAASRFTSIFFTVEFTWVKILCNINILLYHCVDNLLPVGKWDCYSTDIGVTVGLLCGCVFTCFRKNEVATMGRNLWPFVSSVVYESFFEVSFIKGDKGSKSQYVICSNISGNYFVNICTSGTWPIHTALITCFCCHSSLCNSLTASFRSNARKKESDYKTEDNYSSQLFKPKPGSPSKENSSSYIQTQEDIFHLRHGLLVLHILATLMFVPSLVSWLQRIGMHQSFPRFLDSFLCICLILHGIYSWESMLNSELPFPRITGKERIGMHQSFPRFLDSFLCICLILHGTYSWESMLNSELPFPRITGKEVRLNLIYLTAGFYSYLSGMTLEPYKVLYAMGAVGIISFALSVLQAFTGATRFGRRRHWHMTLEPYKVCTPWVPLGLFPCIECLKHLQEQHDLEDDDIGTD